MPNFYYDTEALLQLQLNASRAKTLEIALEHLTQSGENDTLDSLYHVSVELSDSLWELYHVAADNDMYDDEDEDAEVEKLLEEGEKSDE